MQNVKILNGYSKNIFSQLIKDFHNVTEVRVQTVFSKTQAKEQVYHAQWSSDWSTKVVEGIQFSSILCKTMPPDKIIEKN